MPQENTEKVRTVRINIRVNVLNEALVEVTILLVFSRKSNDMHEREGVFDEKAERRR